MSRSTRGRPPSEFSHPTSVTMPSSRRSRTTFVTEVTLSPVAALRFWRLLGRLAYSDERTTALFSRRRSSTVLRRRCCIAPLNSNLETKVPHKTSVNIAPCPLLKGKDEKPDSRARKAGDQARSARWGDGGGSRGSDPARVI